MTAMAQLYAMPLKPTNPFVVVAEDWLHRQITFNHAVDRLQALGMWEDQAEDWLRQFRDNQG